ncbi:hypothetical protein [Streptosporangium jomthongense]|uniref:Uncharacterized protein n=1 Tax=Streptosporangium jomthongense TaxID=1193683 RepID=A0ABV8ETQ7_9ACTN
MTALLALLAVLTVRPTSTDARTLAQLVAAVRAAGWARVTGRALQITVVALLLVMAVAARMRWHTAAAIGSLAVLLAASVATLGTAQLPGGVS